MQAIRISKLQGTGQTWGTCPLCWWLLEAGCGAAWSLTVLNPASPASLTTTVQRQCWFQFNHSTPRDKLNSLQRWDRLEEKAGPLTPLTLKREGGLHPLFCRNAVKRFRFLSNCRAVESTPGVYFHPPANLLYNPADIAGVKVFV